VVPSVPRRLATPRNPRNLDVFKLESFGTQIKIQFSVLLIMNSIGLWPFCTINVCGVKRDYMVNRLTGNLEGRIILKTSKTKSSKIEAPIQHTALRTEAGCLNRKVGGL
jgi:hypothetical protein